MRLPDHVFETVKRVAAKYPGKRSHRDFALALNEIAWTHRGEGFGLSEKTGGKRANHPVLGDIAEDILQLEDGTHWDIFSGADEGAPMVPNQPDAIVPNTPRKWLEPVDPGREVIVPAPDPVPVPTPTPAPPVVVAPACKCRCGEVLEAISKLPTRSEVDSSKDALYNLISQVLIGTHVDDMVKRLDAIEGLLGDLKGRRTCRLL